MKIKIFIIMLLGLIISPIVNAEVIEGHASTPTTPVDFSNLFKDRYLHNSIFDDPALGSSFEEVTQPERKQ